MVNSAKSTTDILEGLSDRTLGSGCNNDMLTDTATEVTKPRARVEFMAVISLLVLSIVLLGAAFLGMELHRCS